METLTDENEIDEDRHARFVELVTRARKGDKQACGELLEQWRDYLLLIANQDLEPSLQTRIAPSDVVQQSMLDAQRKLQAFRGQSAPEFQTWVRQILKNNISDARRGQNTQKRGGQHQHLDAFDSTNEIPIVDTRLTPQTNAIQLEQSERMKAAMATLPEEQQEVLRRRNWGNDSFAQIAGALNRDEREIRKLWYRAIVGLQKAMGSPNS